MEFLACPAHMNDDGSVRCGLPAEVTCRFTMRSSDGPLESVMIQCPARHRFSAPVEFLTFEGDVSVPGESPEIQVDLAALDDSLAAADNDGQGTTMPRNVR